MPASVRSMRSSFKVPSSVRPSHSGAKNTVAEAVGSKLAKILIDTGAKAILDYITQDREKRIGEAKTEEEKETIEAAIAA